VKSDSYGYFIIKCDNLQDADHNYSALIKSIVSDNLSTLKSDALNTFMDDYADKCDVVYYKGDKAGEEETASDTSSDTSSDSSDTTSESE
jgi:hypothetical protein